MKQAYPHERRVQRYAHAANAALTGLALVLATRHGGDLFGYLVPAIAVYGLALAGFLTGVLAAHRRAAPLALAGVGLQVLAVLPGGRLETEALDHVLGLAFGVAALAFVELVHMTVRYERAHAAVERDNVPEDHINRVTDEAIKTLGGRAGLALLVAALAVGLSYLLTLIGPRQWRDAIETASPLGVAVTGLALLGAGGLYVLIRGSRFRREPTPPKETAPDVAE